MPTLGAVMLSWKRQDNVTKITESWVKCPLFENRIVWTNKHQIPKLPVNVRSVFSNTDLGLYTRFHAGILTRCDAVFIQDDDLFIPHGTIVQLFNKWRIEPDRIHTLFGRGPRKDGTYAESYDHEERECEIALTRTLIVSVELLCRFMFDVRQFLDMQAITYGNAEDIILSYVAMRYSGKLNRVWNFPRQELSPGDQLHQRNWGEHLQHRTRVMQACQQWLRKEGIK